MNISFICIENDHLTISQSISAAGLINKHLGVDFENIRLLVKPARKIPGVKNESRPSLFMKLRGVTIKRLINSIRIRMYLKTVKHIINGNISVKIQRLSGSSASDLAASLRPANEHLLFFVYYDEIIKEPILSSYTALNVHPGFLPEYRGVSPIYWQIMEKQQIGAITVHRMSAGIDEGDIVAEVPFLIDSNKQPFEIDIDNHKAQVIANALFIATRRILKFGSNFGISQSLFTGTPKYFGRPPC